jgi:hypothetical protein
VAWSCTDWVGVPPGIMGLALAVVVDATLGAGLIVGCKGVCARLVGDDKGVRV